MLILGLDGIQWRLFPAGDTTDLPEAIRRRFGVEKSLEASVPGCVHTALIDRGWMEDPYVDQREEEVRGLGLCDWVYEGTFSVDDHVLADLGEQEHLEMVFPSLDTIAVVLLNGVRIGQAANMHVTWRFDVRQALRRGDNELRIEFRSPVRYAREQEAKLGTLPYLNTKEPFNFIRKMACNFGWDWGPALPTCGMWRAPRLERWGGSRLEAVRPLVMEADEHRARVDVHVDVVGPDAGAVTARIRLLDPDGRLVAERLGSAGEHRIVLEVDAPKRWWPRGHGDQPLYPLTVELIDGADRCVDQWQGRIGLRTVRLDTEPDAIGSRFILEVNGRAIYCQGANWIPDDCFLDRACRPERYRQRLEQACAMNMNMIRVWGGGIYETEAFYDICDELGLMVWQDFLFACAGYPEEEPYAQLVAIEARQNVARLSRHASLMIWNGCNENVWGYHVWGWKRDGKVAGRTWGLGYYFDLLERIRGELDPSRPYWPASPWSGDRDVDGRIDPNAAEHGNKHVWEAWFGDHYTAYRRFQPRFCSEFGFQAPGNIATLSRAVSARPSEGLNWRDEAWWSFRQKCGGGDERNLRHLEHGFIDPGPGDARHYLLQLNQARALRTGIEWFRALWPVCGGAVFWQLNDCWPAVSWAVLDYGGAWKPAAYAVRRAMAPRLLTIHPVDDELVVFAINDTDEPWVGNMAVSRLDFIGRPLYAGRSMVDVPPRSVGRISLGRGELARPQQPEREFLLADCGGHQALWFFRPDRELRDEPVELDATLKRVGDQYDLTLTSRALVRDCCLAVDRLDPEATISEQVVTLLPEEPYTFSIASRRELTAEQLTQRPVFWTSSALSGEASLAAGT
ncbi:MAG: glycoside hydrolase family 2 protein [Phycisphaeraceae bacterium]|nr:glycoside hydrolase family 2 protein [Phycisphaeraceae bacterium]